MTFVSRAAAVLFAGAAALTSAAVEAHTLAMPHHHPHPDRGLVLLAAVAVAAVVLAAALPRRR